MARRIFISYQRDDRMKAKGFNLLRWNKNVNFEFVGRHLLDPVDSKNKKYIRQQIKEQLSGTSVTVVLIGKNTAGSDWVADEVKWSLDKENGVVGIRLEPNVTTPPSLSECGAEVIDWDPHSFESAIERAAKWMPRTRAIAAAGVGGSDCGR